MKRSQKFDLGLDRTRIKDPRDAERQTVTVEALLNRMFHPKDSQRWELQILADEVGMGKTFVGLGVALSLLDAMRNREVPDDLRGCYQKVLIVTPNNSALFSKWRKEVGEFVKRCVLPEHRTEVSRWFVAAPVERLDELVAELRKPGFAPRVVVANMGIFDGKRLHHYDIKRRHLLGVLFRYWGIRFSKSKRKLLLKGAPDNWSPDPGWFDVFDDKELDRLLFCNKDLSVGLRQLDRKEDVIENLLETCKEIATPYVRGRDELFSKVETQLIRIYRKLMGYLLNKSLPFVIVDEAHNWKNGPSKGSNGYKGFVDLIGCRTRRVLLLTATPFQLRPAEMLEILKVSDQQRICPTEADSSVRRDRLHHHRESVIRPILERATRHSRSFARAWSKLPPSVTSETLKTAWECPSLSQARIRLTELAKQAGVARTKDVEQIIEQAIVRLDPEIRQLIREALRLFVYNCDLSHELGAIVIRHRRHTEHRLFLVGTEYPSKQNGVTTRPDRHVLHAAPGVDVQGDGELPHYLLMRCVSEMKGGQGRSSLGSALTGCYSTLVDSAEGRSVQKRLAQTPLGKVYLDLLMRMVDTRQDPKHPKVREVVNSAVENWKAGEKTLIFCFRTNTAKRLHEIIDGRIREELHKRREKCMGGPESLRALRGRLTGRDRDLVVLGLDRVLWSVLWYKPFRDQATRPMTPDDLKLREDELQSLAELGLRYGVELLSDRVDRVFLHRATEHILGQRFLHEVKPTGQLEALLNDMADETWVCGPYGQHAEDEEEGSESEIAHFDERGVHTVYQEREEDPDPRIVQQIAKELKERRERVQKQGRTAVLDIYHRGPNLWLDADPPLAWHQQFDQTHPGNVRTIGEMHEHVWGLTVSEDGLDWSSRLRAFQAIRRAVLRESVLLRLLPSQTERHDSGWGELLVEKYFEPLPQQSESTADRIGVFLEDLRAASGSMTDSSSARYALYDATRLRDQQFVALVSGTHGSKDKQTRERVFSGFNTPLLPEILICTSVGQEGIDLHRHCRHVVHFDLAWNPAVMEQRTGRTDRIGSKTFRERSLGNGFSDAFLEIGVPFLAGTYDERMYEELRLRAQTFEVLTGGELTADEAEGRDDHKNAEGKEAGLRFITLPDSIVEALRVNLHIWQESGKEKTWQSDAVSDCQPQDSDTPLSNGESTMHKFLEPITIGCSEDAYQQALDQSEFVVNNPDDPQRRTLHAATCNTIRYALTEENPTRDPKAVFADRNDLLAWMKEEGIETIPICQKPGQPCQKLSGMFGMDS